MRYVACALGGLVIVLASIALFVWGIVIAEAEGDVAFTTGWALMGCALGAWLIGISDD